MTQRAQVYNNAVESGGSCPCATPPTQVVTTMPAPGKPVRVNGFRPILRGDTLTPANGMTCTSNPSPCVSPRTVLESIPSKVRINGKSVAKVGDYLNMSTNIRLVNATQAATVNFA